MIVGIDEVGRGPWAGPLVVGAVVLGDATFDGLTDSKKLTKKRREELSAAIVEHAAAYGLGWVDAAEIDEIGLSASLTLATKRALEQITSPYHEIIIDGTVNFLAGTRRGEYVTTMKKADLLIAAVSAASIIAKVARDDYMAECDELFPGYGFASHVGYGTAKHAAAIEQLGICGEHRKSFAPIRRRLHGAPERPITVDGSATQRGNQAESVVGQWLQERGYVVLDRNWKTRFCEIDIVAIKDGVVHFVEVKHRKTDRQGGGIAAITERKLRQMRFAASLYLARHPALSGQLAVVTTSGGDSISVDQLLLVE